MKWQTITKTTLKLTFEKKTSKRIHMHNSNSNNTAFGVFLKLWEFSNNHRQIRSDFNKHKPLPKKKQVAKALGSLTKTKPLLENSTS